MFDRSRLAEKAVCGTVVDRKHIKKILAGSLSSRGGLEQLPASNVEAPEKHIAQPENVQN